MSMPTRLLTAQTVTGDGPSIRLRNVRSRDEVLVQVAIAGGTATVNIYGRLAVDLPWVLITNTSIDAILPITRVAELKANVSAINGATCDCVVFID